MTGGMSLGQASPSMNGFASGQAAAYKMFETINRKPIIDAYDDSGIALEDIRGDIELRDVYFRYPARPDKLDVVLMIVGTLGAAGNGASQPLMVVIFGQLIDSFGFSSPTSLMDKISKVSLNYVYLAIGTGIAAFLRNGSDEVSCWTVTGERQATRIRGWEVYTIRSGFWVALLLPLWKDGFVLLSCIPAIVIAAGGMAIMMSKMSSCQVAYAEAGNVVEQTVGAIRTVRQH
ncbi:hypothetical protein FNV43_RR00244 [Rhamnella rubrinervis]|uniref:ABC transmembrane type-1 domain-containing protein n=1 Tax=Rhamnella rubrinervis TaxID=2594499 RepID=A0A8K0HQ79_9ROSA|nr:hypothetical protein FNV43_RR00244 [Rhamnella rubrinervis]